MTISTISLPPTPFTISPNQALVVENLGPSDVYWGRFPVDTVAHEGIAQPSRTLTFFAPFGPTIYLAAANASQVSTTFIPFPQAAAMLGTDGTVGGPGGSPLSSSAVSVSSPNGAAQVPGVAPAVSVDDYLIGASSVAAGIASAINAATNGGTTEGHLVFTPGKTYAYGSGSTPTIPANLPGRGLVIEWIGAVLQPSSSARRAFDLASGSPGRTFNYELRGGTVDANWLGGLHHVVIGTYQNGGVSSGVDINLGRVVHRNIKVINVLTDANTGTNHRRGFLYYLTATSTSPTVGDVLFEDCSVDGGNAGFEVLGSSSAIAIDTVRHVRCHAKARAPLAAATITGPITLSGTPQTITLSTVAGFAASGVAMAATVATNVATSPVPLTYTSVVGSTLVGCTGSGTLPDGAWVSQHGQSTTFGPQAVWFPSAGFQTGSVATVAHVTWEECSAKYYGDEGTEVNNQDYALFDRCVFEDNFKANNFHENFSAPLNPDMQVLVYRNCTCRQVLNTISTFVGNCYENAFGASFPGGAIVWEGKCPTLDSTGRVYANGQMVHVAGNVRHVDLDGLRCVLNNFNYAGSTTVSHGIAQIATIAPAAGLRPVIQLGRSTWKVAGQRSGSGAYSMDAILSTSTSAAIGSIQPTFDFAVSGVANGSLRCIEINGAGTTPTLTGGLIGGVVKSITGDAAPRAIFIRGTASVTINGRFPIRGWDFSGMPSGGSEVLLADNTNRAALVCSDNTGCGSTALDNPAVASAATVTLPLEGEYFNISGTTQITTLTADYSGRRVSLIFTNASPGGMGNTGNLFLSAAFSPTTDGMITLVCNGTNWFEASRSANR